LGHNFLFNRRERLLQTDSLDAAFARWELSVAPGLAPRVLPVEDLPPLRRIASWSGWLQMILLQLVPSSRLWN